MIGRFREWLQQLQADLECWANRHDWIARGTYRRICRNCPQVEILLPEEGWVRSE